MTQLMKTGVEGLDRVLCGGFLYHNSILLKGAPGCGKTTLGIQVVYNGAVKYDEPGVVVLFEQFPQQLYRDLATYGWDLDAVAAQDRLRVIFARPEEVVSHDRMVEPPLVAHIHQAAMEIGAKRVLIDSVSHILNLANDRRDARAILLKFINSLKSIGLTPLMTAEAEDREGAIGIDEYLSDCVILLGSEAARDRSFQLRELTIRKTRGHDHLRGRHPFKLSDRGVEVFPRAAGRGAGTEAEGLAEGGAPASLAKVSSGISGLDEMLGGGYARGTSTIVAGMPGTFKTTLAAQFATKGAAAGEKSLIISFSERPAFLASLMGEKGLPVAAKVAAGELKLWHFEPKTVYMEEILALLEAECQKGGLTRLVVDSLNEIERGTEDPNSYKDIVSAFLSVCADHGVTSLFTQKLDKFTGNAPLADIGYASMFDGIVYLGTIEIESSVLKVISILKMRGGAYASDVREIVCKPGGLQVLDKFIGLSGVLSGNAQGQYKKNVEEIFQPLYFVRDFIEVMAGQPDLPEEQRAMLVSNLQSETGRLVGKLREHFDVK